MNPEAPTAGVPSVYGNCDSVAVNCSDDVEWDRYYRHNEAIWGFDHLRPRGIHTLPVFRTPRTRDLAYVFSGAPAANVSRALNAMRVPHDARLSTIVRKKGERPDTPDELARYAQKISERGYHFIVESSMKDVFGPLAKQMIGKGFPLGDDFKAKGLVMITREELKYEMVRIFFETSTGGRCPADQECGAVCPHLARDLGVLYAEHYARMPAAANMEPNVNPMIAVRRIRKMLGPFYFRADQQAMEPIVWDLQ